MVARLNSLTIENQELRALSEMAKQTASQDVSIEALREMFNEITEYETCKQMFMQVDYYLHKNKVWKAHYEELRDIVESKRDNNKSITKIDVEAGGVLVQQAQNVIK